jgi:hypothetical protein
MCTIMLSVEQRGGPTGLLPGVSTYNGHQNSTEIMRIVMMIINSGFPQAKGISPKIIRNLDTRSQNFAHNVVRWKDLKNVGFKRRQIINRPLGANMSRTGPDLLCISGLSFGSIFVITLDFSVPSLKLDNYKPFYIDPSKLVFIVAR